MSRGNRSNLTHQQRLYCIEYLKDLNQVQASIRAGYSPRSAQKIAWKVHTLPQVQEYLQPLLAKTIEKTQLSAERVLEEMARIAFANLADYYKHDENKKKWVIKELDELTPAQTACMAEYQPGQYIRLYNKDTALDKLSKHFKLYTDLEAGVTNFTVMPVLRINGKEVIFEVGKPAPKIG